MVEVKKPTKPTEPTGSELKSIAVADKNIKPQVIDDPIIIPGLDDKKLAKVQERATLNEAEAKRLDLWLEQIERRFEGFIKLNKSELVNFLIRRHPDLLSREELEKIKVENYDEAKFLKWAVGRLESAKKAGEDLRLADLFNAYRTVLDKSPAASEKKAKDKNNKTPEGAPPQTNATSSSSVSAAKIN